ncbi:hypothetical protein B0H17DRAFT_514795 [Mycena rosella]|uniref:Uncharacterized protein n=1 Tax=Mycena rosella TaxID=1033263 RepID=A0AAD7M9R6_MYCRO|nr:hypothetical protein B0H17DRAFT_514795 [Mycena rosella]
MQLRTTHIALDAYLSLPPLLSSIASIGFPLVRVTVHSPRPLASFLALCLCLCIVFCHLPHILSNALSIGCRPIDIASLDVRPLCMVGSPISAQEILFAYVDDDRISMLTHFAKNRRSWQIRLLSTRRDCEG